MAKGRENVSASYRDHEPSRLPAPRGHPRLAAACALGLFAVDLRDGPSLSCPDARPMQGVRPPCMARRGGERTVRVPSQFAESAVPTSDSTPCMQRRQDQKHKMWRGNSRHPTRTGTCVGQNLGACRDSRHDRPAERRPSTTCHGHGGARGVQASRPRERLQWTVVRRIRGFSFRASGPSPDSRPG